MMRMMGYENRMIGTAYIHATPRQIFVPHDYKGCRYPKSIIFYYKIPDSTLVVDYSSSASSKELTSNSPVSNPSWSVSEQSLLCLKSISKKRQSQILKI